MKTFQSILLTAITFSAYFNLQGQVDVQNNGILHVATSTDVIYINGSFINATGAALTNNGNLYISNNLSNGQLSMTAGTGRLYLNGSLPQQITGTQVFRTYHLVSDNIAGILLNNDLSVGGQHTFTNGIISTSATPNYLIYEAGSSYTGDDDSRHVSGWIRKSGATPFVFPVGNGTVERTIAVSNLTSPSVFNARYEGATTNTGNVASPLFTVDPNEYWQINRVSGGSANVDLNWDNAKITMPNYAIPDMRVANYMAGNWTQVGGTASGNTITTGTISSNLLSDFGAFTIGSVSVILPLQLLKFSAIKNNGFVSLKWTTTDEVNVSHHEPQRSDDGLLFSAIGSVPARNMQGTTAYVLSDTKVLTGTVYYRLRSIDNDGRVSMSKVVTVSGESTPAVEINIINPSFKTIHGFATNLAGTFQYHLNSMSGQTIQQGTVLISSAGFHIPLTGAVNRGLYLLHLQKPGFSIVRKVMVGN